MGISRGRWAILLGIAGLVVVLVTLLVLVLRPVANSPRAWAGRGWTP